MLLQQHGSVDQAERDAVAHLRRLLRAADDPFLRTTLPAHVTASAVVLDPNTGRVLLHLHRRLGRWLQPGGHVEAGERPEDAAVRETIEETGLSVGHPDAGPTLIHLDEHPGPDGHVHLDLRYLLLADQDAPARRGGEQTGVGPGPTLRWASADEVRQLSDRSLSRAMDALSARSG